MRTSRLVSKELAASPGSTGALVLAIALSVATAVAGIATTAALTHEMRVVMKRMGNNIVVMAPDSEIEDFGGHSNDRPRMSEGELRRLSRVSMTSDSPIDFAPPFPAETSDDQPAAPAAPARDIPLRHLIPELRGTFSAGGRILRIIGIGPEMDLREERVATIPRGTVVLGSEAARRLGLAAGGRLELGERTFDVTGVAGADGSPDDAAVRMHLADAQGLLGAGRRITAITALACVCHSKFIKHAQQMTQRAMPEALVITKFPIARARMKARKSVKRFGRILTAAVAALGALVVLFALWGNVSGRMEELGTLLAIGARPSRLVMLIGWKVLLLAALGAATGWALGTFAAAKVAPAFAAYRVAFDVRLLGPAVAVAIGVAALGSVAPLVRIFRLDAARIIREA